MSDESLPKFIDYDHFIEIYNIIVSSICRGLYKYTYNQGMTNYDTWITNVPVVEAIRQSPLSELKWKCISKENYDVTNTVDMTYDWLYDHPECISTSSDDSDVSVTTDSINNITILNKNQTIGRNQSYINKWYPLTPNNTNGRISVMNFYMPMSNITMPLTF